MRSKIIAAVIARLQTCLSPTFIDMYGLCHQVSRVVSDPLDEDYIKWESEAVGVDSSVRRLMRSWPEYSGDPDYPVKHTDHSDPGDAYNFCSLWVGEYGATRRRLAQYLIDELEKGVLDAEV